MRTIMLGCFTALLAVTSSMAQDVPACLRTPYNSKEFTKIEKYSDEFDKKSIDDKKWNAPVDNNFATWTFVPDNVSQSDGSLKLTMSYDKHVRGKGKNQKDLYFNSGMLRSKTKVGYGYYEARIKGAPVWPGTCSAFWLYTIPNESKKEVENVENAIIYNEIDVIELQQVAKSKDILSCNMHVWVLDENLNTKRLMAGQYPKLGKNEMTFKNWDGEKDYHIYAVENRPDSVVYYIDNKRVAAKPNYFWHMDMYLILSLGLRTPFEKYVKNVRMAMPTTPEEAAQAGFPCNMEVDYIRSWKRDYSQFQSSKKDYDKEEINQYLK